MAAADGSSSYRFLHLYGGTEDKLKAALLAKAEAQGISLEVESYDIARGHDLTDPSLVARIKR